MDDSVCLHEASPHAAMNDGGEQPPADSWTKLASKASLVATGHGAGWHKEPGARALTSGF
jgi:hypothetical protein